MNLFWRIWSFFTGVEPVREAFESLSEEEVNRSTRKDTRLYPWVCPRCGRKAALEDLYKENYMCSKGHEWPIRDIYPN